MLFSWLVLVACGVLAPKDSESAGCPVALVAPESLEWSDVVLGESAPGTLSVVNDCAGSGALSVLATLDSPAFSTEVTAASLEPGGVTTLAVLFTPTDYAPASGTLLLETNDPDQSVIAIPLTGTVDPDADGDGHEAEGAGGDDCDDGDAETYAGAPDAWYDGVDSDCDGADDYDQDADGYRSSTYDGDDCADYDPAIHPGASDTWYDGVDSDCDGADDYDRDADGHAAADYGGDDCDDDDDAVYPGAEDPWYDGVDENCDGADDDDQDADGHAAEAYGGDDCDDTTPEVHPGLADTWYDGVDTNCDGADDYDQDADGHAATAHGGDDCDDTNPSYHPDAVDAWYDGLDHNCDGADDFDQDADGHGATAYGGDDCDDTDSATRPGAADGWYDGVDSDCDGADDYDQDADGHDAAGYGGEDCDDTDPFVNPDARDTWYDGVDSDCDGADDYDQDGDGHELDVYGGDDCDDTEPTIHPGARDAWYDGADSNCDGADDYDQDADGSESEDWGGDDCVDTDAGIRPGAADAWYDGVDQNCDGADDYDQDADGHEAADYDGDDCADTDRTIHPGATERWYDGIDQDCDLADDYDQDGDSYRATSAGGDDCVDTVAAVHPGTVDVWYDGVDQDCDGGDDYDQDGDGVDKYPWGADCADTDPLSTAGSAEVANGIDDDCDGAVDEGFIAEGDLVVTEVLANPAAVSDTVGEWFEVYNPGSFDIDLSGWTVRSDDGGSFAITTSTVVPAGGYVVFGASGDTATNGGVAVDYVYDRAAFTLGDNGDSIYLEVGSTTVAGLSWSSLWPETSGVAMGLDDDHHDAAGATDSLMWCAATTRWASGDRGTPGEPNPECGSLDDDRDGATASSDCDDDDVDVYPSAVEVEDGIDDNCNGYTDEAWGSPGVTPTVWGPDVSASTTLLGLGDYDGDGELELATRDLGADTVYLLSGPGYASWSGTPAELAERTLRPSSVAADVAARSAAFGDATGDGIDDLLYGGQGSTTASWSLFAGPISGGSGTVAPTVQFESSTDGHSSFVVDGGHDFDGDGVNEVVWANPSSYATSSSAWGGSVGVFAVGTTTGSLGWADAEVRLTGTADQQCGVQMRVADVDADGQQDLAVGCYNGDIYLWVGDGLSSPGTDTLASAAATRIDLPSNLGYDLVAVADLDADGRADVGWGAVSWSWLLGPGETTGTLSGASPDVSSDLYGWAAQATLDTDGDGVGEQLWNQWQTSGTAVLTFADDAADDGVLDADDASWAAFGASAPYATGDAADLDGDGTVELLLSTASGAWTEGAITVLPTGL